MAKIFFNRYMDRINNGEITLAEAIALAEEKVPVIWREAVISLLEAQA